MAQHQKKEFTLRNTGLEFVTHSIALYMLNCLHQEAAEGKWPLFNIVYNIESSMEQMDVDGYGRIKPKDTG